MGKLDGRVGVITGGSSGIALGTAKLFAAEAKVAVTDRRQQGIDDAPDLLERREGQLGPAVPAREAKMAARSATVGARAQFLVDGECLDVQEGSALRISPAAARAWRNNSDAPLYFLCIQYRADGVIRGGTLDGQVVEGKPAWADRGAPVADRSRGQIRQGSGERTQP